MHTISSKYVKFFWEICILLCICMYMHDKNLIKTKLILLIHVEQLLLLIKHNVDTTWIQLRPLKTQTL
jgi:hypothetical protein